MITLKELKKSDFESEPYIDVRLRDGFLTIEVRPHYCDRGSYIVKIFPEANQFHLHVDHSDMFPRYYFKFENMVSELGEWMVRNKQAV